MLQRRRQRPYLHAVLPLLSPPLLQHLLLLLRGEGLRLSPALQQTLQPQQEECLPLALLLQFPGLPPLCLGLLPQRCQQPLLWYLGLLLPLQHRALLQCLGRLPLQCP